MSFLLPKTPGIDPRKEVISATHDIICEDSLKEFLEGSLWSIPSQNQKPLCILHEGKREDHSVSEVYLAGLKELQTGIFELDDDEQQQFPGNGQASRDSACAEDQQAGEEYLVEELVSKIVSHFCIIPECSESFRNDPVTECEDWSLQDTKVGASIAGLENPNLELELSQASSEGFLVNAGANGLLLPQSVEKVVSLSFESSVGPTKLKSALRGGNERQGLGPRPKVQVTWAPDVYDPPCTSASHTSSRNHKRHHQLRSDHKNRHKGKPSNHADSSKKSQKKLLRRLKRPSEGSLSSLTVVDQRGIPDSSLFWKEYVASSLDDVTLKSAKANDLVLPLKGCYMKTVLSVVERNMVSVDKIQSCRPHHVQAQELCL